jgi:hypothetical protein
MWPSALTTTKRGAKTTSGRPDLLSGVQQRADQTQQRKVLGAVRIVSEEGADRHVGCLSTRARGRLMLDDGQIGSRVAR